MGLLDKELPADHPIYGGGSLISTGGKRPRRTKPAAEKAGAEEKKVPEGAPPAPESGPEETEAAASPTEGRVTIIVGRRLKFPEAEKPAATNSKLPDFEPVLMDIIPDMGE